ncbi:DUF6789 family protein [Microbulbifer epialgicus]|uniref:DUF6789 family protein n=1 Tax=Microbulbifer epialgicus TaxID=393907 RepID=A0ABV4P7J5_9GAMM
MYFIRVFLSGVAGGVAWVLGMLIFFGPAQTILADPQLQSAKFLTVVKQMEPLPRMADNLWVGVLGLLMIGVIYGIVFSFIESLMSGKSLIKGVKFGAISWALMVPWFEFYLPWNVMHEPLVLVILEALLWACVLQLVGISISLTSNLLDWGKPIAQIHRKV